MAALKARLVAIRQQIMPGTKLAKACDYALGQWSRLEVYLQNGLVEIDNHWCEGGMAPPGPWPQELVAPWECGSRAESGGHRVDH